jgi:hypothetical protein
MNRDADDAPGWAGKGMSREDRLAADVFGKSYREFLALKPTHYRWSHLAPQGVALLEQAEEGSWSHEKIADFLHCEVDEAAACLRRYKVSRKVNAKGSESERLKQALAEWVGQQPGMEDAGEAEKRRRAEELALIVANHLHAAALAREDFMKLSRELEGAEDREEKAAEPPKDEPRRWGPQWKD